MKLIEGMDGLPAGDVGEWALEKHDYLLRYLNLASPVRKKFIGPGGGGATYIDLFCATGLSQIRGTGEWIDGSAITAWKSSKERGTPFSMMYIADQDEVSLRACAERLSILGAPVKTFHGQATDTVHQINNDIGNYSLNFAFIDPYNLESLDFRIIENLSRHKRIDMLIHFSRMDLNRNLWTYIEPENTTLDSVIPGWRNKVNLTNSQSNIQTGLIRAWRNSINDLGTTLSVTHRLIRGSNRQPLYHLFMAARSDLALRFWDIATNSMDRQRQLF